MRKRRLNLFKRVCRFILLSLPYLFYLFTKLVNFVNKGVQSFSVWLLDKLELSDYEKLKESEKYEML